MRSSIIIGVEPSSLINFRGPLLKSMVFHGFTVTTLSKRPTCAQMIELKNMGVTNESVPFLRAKLSIFSDLKVLVSLVRKYKNIRPNIVLAYTIKPVIWGGIAARFLNTDFYALITGLGFAFQEVSFKRKILSKLVTFLYKLALKNSKAVIFQNKDNCDVFVSKGIVELSRAHVVNGSGVNLEKYNVENFPSGSIKFLCISRLLGEKGLREYAEAAKIVKN